MDIRDATRKYEAWLVSRTAVVRSDLQLKHERMRESPFVFLRATYYRWSTECPKVCRKVYDGPHVLSVGDLHVENFGTWRDYEGRLVWGVNDVDEAGVLPYTNDLIRLATSAVLAERDGALAMPMRRVCEAIVEGYTASLERGGRPIVLAERRRWLREVAMSELRDPIVYWRKLDELPKASGPVPLRVLRAAMPEGAHDVRIRRRVAGAGSLGRPRFVAIGEWNGGFVAREAKAFLGSEKAAVRLMTCTTRSTDPYLSIVDGWVVRRLAPDCSRIEMTDLPRRRDERRLLRAMGFEAASIHAATPGAARSVRRHLAGRRARWLERAADAMVESTIEDWKAWKKLAR